MLMMLVLKILFWFTQILFWLSSSIVTELISLISFTIIVSFWSFMTWSSEFAPLMFTYATLGGLTILTTFMIMWSPRWSKVGRPLHSLSKVVAWFVVVVLFLCLTDSIMLDLNTGVTLPWLWVNTSWMGVQDWSAGVSNLHWSWIESHFVWPNVCIIGFMLMILLFSLLIVDSSTYGKGGSLYLALLF
uniref:NADH dehydrogenase subunit 6 n=1 Tax=Haematomyzus elephantis TaxID=160133 RepID=A0A0R5QN29_9NEOP|nr:NADH dehydrogenase subunit 6 [Haematomyzus elephantis]